MFPRSKSKVTFPCKGLGKMYARPCETKRKHSRCLQKLPLRSSKQHITSLIVPKLHPKLVIKNDWKVPFPNSGRHLSPLCLSTPLSLTTIFSSHRSSTTSSNPTTIPLAQNLIQSLQH